MQGTVKTYDPESRGGVLLTDDAVEVAFDAKGMEGSSLRLLRVGQRIDFQTEDIDGQPVARSLKIPTF
jgi:2-phospho-L-lactate guanylyltransferase